MKRISNFIIKFLGGKTEEEFATEVDLVRDILRELLNEELLDSHESFVNEHMVSKYKDDETLLITTSRVRMTIYSECFIIAPWVRFASIYNMRGPNIGDFLEKSK